MAAAPPTKDTFPSLNEMSVAVNIEISPEQMHWPFKGTGDDTLGYFIYVMLKTHL